ncbi:MULTISPECIES: hypothetical protein [unclassified Sporosarcina]|uniref:hypothetical protein n=1 Tax=unclassified Sporosarcina TaxID=2647733 RepID=UPI00203EFA21|nr:MULTISPECIES: hypothetical protein [unclassified Sporosarcina]GKV65212.1 hypothetical protein NCCP2331_13650 [Sporosarcina sp. NCCP-2331]GLB55336.1 hypothetical protein NCCP2378_11220 [Sporosarcina sp. NCCP-2378]
MKSYLEVDKEFRDGEEMEKELYMSNSMVRRVPFAESETRGLVANVFVILPVSYFEDLN